MTNSMQLSHVMTEFTHERANGILHLPCTIRDRVKCWNVADEELASLHVASVKVDLLSEPSERVQYCITDVTQETVRSKVQGLGTSKEPSSGTKKWTTRNKLTRKRFQYKRVSEYRCMMRAKRNLSPQTDTCTTVQLEQDTLRGSSPLRDATEAGAHSHWLFVTASSTRYSLMCPREEGPREAALEETQERFLLPLEPRSTTKRRQRTQRRVPWYTRCQCVPYRPKYAGVE